MKKNILIIDSDASTYEKLKNILQSKIINVSYALSAHEGVELFLRHNYCLVILDVFLVEMDGMSLIKTLRSAKNVPIMVLSGLADQTFKIDALLNGADDYLSKPFHEGELSARVLALIRRYTEPRDIEKQLYAIMPSADFIIDPQYRTIELKGKRVELTKKEFEILYLLARHPQQVFTKIQIYNEIWDSEFLANENSVMCHIRRIRAKLKAIAPEANYLQTVWGVGYRFAPVISEK